MNSDKYKKTLNIFFIVIFVSFFIDQVGELLAKQSLVYRKYHYYSEPILALVLFYIGLYAQIAGVKVDRVWQRPIVFIAIGIILITMSIGAPVFAHVVYKVNPLLAGTPADELERIKIAATNGKPNTAEGYTYAHRYYLETGETITYRDEKKLVKIFSPDERGIQARTKIAQYQIETKLILDDARNSALNLLYIFIISGILFLGFTLEMKRRIKH